MRPKFLRYMGGVTRASGDTLPGVPPRDLTEADIAALDDATLANILATPPFADGSPYSGPLYATGESKAGRIKDEKPTETTPT